MYHVLQPTCKECDQPEIVKQVFANHELSLKLLTYCRTCKSWHEWTYSQTELMHLCVHLDYTDKIIAQYEGQMTKFLKGDCDDSG